MCCARKVDTSVPASTSGAPHTILTSKEPMTPLHTRISFSIRRYRSPGEHAHNLIPLTAIDSIPDLTVAFVRATNRGLRLALSFRYAEEPYALAQRAALLRRISLYEAD
ncbi:unnamed protein product [Arctogadus glacialis]